MPRTFGRYTAFELIGKGGMAQIYVARAETELGATRLAVVKEILPAFADDPRFSEMLIHEAKLAAKLSHKHIVQVFDLGRTGGSDDRLFIAMDYVEGLDLNALLRRCTEQEIGLPAPYALGIVADALSGLDYAHRRTNEAGAPLGIVHRDVSPSNILISYEGEVKLCDFGIAHANELVKESPCEALKGKAGYMSPEHARGEALDARADVFAAGIILWELLAGRRLYRIKDDASLLEQARAAEVRPLPDKSLPNAARLEAIVARALAKDRAERYPSAGAMLRDLEAYLAEAGLLASRLKLGEWMQATFGTALVEQRRASERRLPKSSERVRKATPATDSSATVIPSAPSVPSDLADLAPSLGAMRAFKQNLASEPAPAATEPPPSSLAALDVSPSSMATPTPKPHGEGAGRRAGNKLTLALAALAALTLTAALVAAGVALARVLVH